jgi:phospholipid/cholesterol/gamma-HCH transport system substrate-binding protein
VEIRARYVQVGAFTLAVLIAGFVFVYWLNNAGALRNRALYSVRFESSVSGLLKGSTVLFNGIRVGEVTRLDLDPTYPRRVLATIAVDRTTPVRADTFVTIDFQGLTGSPVIALVGGESKHQLATTEAGQPLLIADVAAGQSMSGAARDVLRRLDGILADNAKPLHTMISNLDTFAGALARNSDKLDGIVAGLERMTGGAAKGRAPIYDLAVPRAPVVLDKASSAQLVIAEPTALSVLDSDRIQSIASNGAYVALADGQWSDLLPKVVQIKLMRSFEDTGLFAGVGRALEGPSGDFQLVIDIRKFHVNPSLSAEVELGAKLVDSKGRVVAARVLRASAAAEAVRAPAAASALEQAFGQVGAELVSWITGTIAELGVPKTVVPKRTVGGG